MEPLYIFVVGLPRTGTKLVMNILENSQDKNCHIAPENFFLGHMLRSNVRQKMRQIGDMSIDSNVKKFVEAMYAGKFFGEYWDRLVDGRLGVDRDTLLQRILHSGRTDKEIYTILLQVQAGVTDDNDVENLVLGDKTGPHLYHVQTLMAWFPEAKVIHTFRDPRAVLASQHKKLLNKRHRRIQKLKAAGKRGQVIFLESTEPVFSLIVVLYVTITWLYAVRLHYKYRKLYPENYYLSQFEDLVSDPERNVRKMCEFLGIEFHEAMLSPAKVDSSYSREAGSGFDKQTLNRWQEYLKPWMNAWLLLWGKKYLKEFGYIR